MTAEEKLQSLIIKYKKHDKQRNDYYANKMKRLGELEAFIQELEDVNNLNSIVETIKNLKAHNKVQKKKIDELKRELDLIRQLLDPEKSYIYRNTSDLQRELVNRIINLEHTVEDYKNKLDKAKKLSNEYLSKLIKLQTK